MNFVVFRLMGWRDGDRLDAALSLERFLIDGEAVICDEDDVFSSAYMRVTRPWSWITCPGARGEGIGV
jgi:hypothetical protein